MPSTSESPCRLQYRLSTECNSEEKDCADHAETEITPDFSHTLIQSSGLPVVPQMTADHYVLLLLYILSYKFHNPPCALTCSGGPLVRAEDTSSTVTSRLATTQHEVVNVVVPVTPDRFLKAFILDERFTHNL